MSLSPQLLEPLGAPQVSKSVALREWVPVSTRNMAGNSASINIGANFVGACFRTFERVQSGVSFDGLKLIYANIYGSETAGANTITVKAAIHVSRGVSYTATATFNSTTIQLSTGTWTTNELQSKVVMITGGTGAGQYRYILSNTSTAITISVGSTAWATTPDATSTFEIFDVYPVYFNNARSIAIDAGAWVTSNEIGAYAAAGVKIYVHTFVSVTAGGQFPGIRRMLYNGTAAASTISAPWYEMTNIMIGGITTATGTGGTDMVDSGDMKAGATYLGIPRDVGAGQNWITAMADANDGGPMIYGPSMIVGRAGNRTKPAFSVGSDSRYKPTPVQLVDSGSAEAPLAAQENGSPFSLAMNQAGCPNIVIARSGETLWQQVGQLWAFRRYLSEFTDYELITPGINDLVSNSQTAVWVLNYLDNRCKSAVAAGRRPVLCTYPPKATSSRNDAGGSPVFVLASDQTTHANNAQIQLVNAAIRAGTASSSAYGYFDLAALVEDGGASAPTGKWKDAPLFTFVDGATTSTVGTVLSGTVRFTDANIPDQTLAPTWGTAFPSNATCFGSPFIKWVTSANGNSTSAYTRLNTLAAGQTKAITLVTAASNTILAGDTYQLYMPYTYWASGSDYGIHLTNYAKWLIANNFSVTPYSMF